MFEKLDRTSDKSLYILIYRLFGHVYEDLKIFGTLYFLDASPFDHYNLHINRSYIEKSKRFSTIIYKTVKIISSHPTVFLHNVKFQLSLANKEDIIIRKKVSTYKGAHLVLGEVRVSLS